MANSGQEYGESALHMKNPQHDQYVRYATRLILIVASLGTLGIMLDQGKGLSIGSVPVIALGISPYVFLALTSHTMDKNFAQSLVLFIAALAISAFGAFCLLWSFYVAPLDPQTPLVFVVLPVYQWAGAIVGTILGKLLGRL